jgi:hypothetical protein
LDVPAAPTIVIESPNPCRDAARAREVLEKTLAPALAPRASWSVTARFSRKGSSLVVESEITDEVDAPVAHRVLSETSADCSSLARAVGVWASLVLDSEVERETQPPQTEPPPAAPAPAPSPPEKSAAEKAVLLEGPEGPSSVEVGLTMFLMGGEGSGAMAGPSLYGVVETGKGWFVRPSIFLARTLEELATSSDIYGTIAAAGFGACRRISGFHIKRITLDLCGGAEIGFIHFDGATADAKDTLPFLALGPSVALRGELGGGLALVLGGVGELNALSEGFSETISGRTVKAQSSLLVGRAELGLSWQLR